MDYLTTLSSPVLINGYVHDIIHRRPNAIKELLVKAIEKKNILIFKAVLENAEADHIKSCNLNILILCVKNCFPEGLEASLQYGYGTVNGIDARSRRTALAVSILNHSSDCAIKLLDSGADPNNGGNGPPPLVLAAKNNDTTVMSHLLKAGAQVDNGDEQGRTALFYAAKSAIGVRMLLEIGASPDSVETSSGSTPLMAACIEGFDRCVEIMATKTRNPNIKDNFGHTSLTYSAIQGHVPAVTALLAVGADLSVCDQNGFSILGLTYRHKQFASMITLLEETAVLPVSRRAAVSPLYLSIRNCELQYAVALLYAGVDRHFVCQAVEELRASNNSQKDYILDRLSAFGQPTPPPLQLLCRKEIRQAIGRKVMQRAYQLDLPPCIIDFIAMKHLEILRMSSPESLLPFVI